MIIFLCSDHKSPILTHSVKYPKLPSFAGSLISLLHPDNPTKGHIRVTGDNIKTGGNAKHVSSQRLDGSVP